MVSQNLPTISINSIMIACMQPTRGDYVLRVRIHSYDNPTNDCAGCDGSQNQRCCDSFDPQCGDDTGLRCDNEFFACVRPLNTSRPTLQTSIDSVPVRSLQRRAELLQCLQPPAAIRSGVNTDAGPIDFMGPTFLGTPNPMEFQVTATEWEVR